MRADIESRAGLPDWTRVTGVSEQPATPREAQHGPLQSHSSIPVVSFLSAEARASSWGLGPCPPGRRGATGEAGPQRRFSPVDDGDGATPKVDGYANTAAGAEVTCTAAIRVEAE